MMIGRVVKMNLCVAIAFVTILGVGKSFAGGDIGSGQEMFSRTEGRAPCHDFDRLRRPFFGDLHVHTSFSFDAIFGGSSPTSDPRAAYRFALGEPVGMPPFDAAGNPAFSVQLRHPLDFTAVTDHAEYFGEVKICLTPDHPGYDSSECVALRQGFPAVPIFFGPLLQSIPPRPERFDFCGPGEFECFDAATTIWQETRAAAQEAYDSTAGCAFTTFIGYEWTGQTGGANLHRNVIFRNAIVPDLPVLRSMPNGRKSGVSFQDKRQSFLVSED